MRSRRVHMHPNYSGRRANNSNYWRPIQSSRSSNLHHGSSRPIFTLKVYRLQHCGSIRLKGDLRRTPVAYARRGCCGSSRPQNQRSRTRRSSNERTVTQKRRSGSARPCTHR
ncbi:unnamed protein product [Nesidiocoris tenuis]|uniref:Uncharacterized protein n=1 Tax=Nesidiocoris tenuis TaxID=355587 RepID=A0A6H5GJD6_9HEMI|nr:unnamed protein product [Nesidiocoris tenuis]